MRLPRKWARLPGAVDFLDTILEDLTDRISVVAGFPDESLSSIFAIEVADLVKQRRLGRWEVVRSTDVRRLVPSKLIEHRFGCGNAAGSVFWIDATDSDMAASAWADYARRFSEAPDTPRLCIAMNLACAGACGEDKRLRRRVWQDFVTSLDARALVERLGRRSGHSSANVMFKSALVGELAGADLAFAERLSRDPLERILKVSDHPREQIWAAQVSVLFPLVERQRQCLLEAYQSLWRLPYTRKNGKVIRCLQDLEIGDLADQAAASSGPLSVERQRLKWLRRVRNQLAHNEVVRWATLTSPVAIDIVDFRR